MLNLELPGVSLLFAVSLIGAFFLRRLSLRGMFRLFYAASKGVVRHWSNRRFEYYLKGGDFF